MALTDQAAVPQQLHGCCRECLAVEVFEFPTHRVVLQYLAAGDVVVPAKGMEFASRQSCGDTRMRAQMIELNQDVFFDGCDRSFLWR